MNMILNRNLDACYITANGDTDLACTSVLQISLCIRSTVYVVKLQLGGVQLN